VEPGSAPPSKVYPPNVGELDSLKSASGIVCRDPTTPPKSATPSTPAPEGRLRRDAHPHEGTRLACWWKL
jgi:hypothetical protein